MANGTCRQAGFAYLGLLMDVVLIGLGGGCLGGMGDGRQAAEAGAGGFCGPEVRAGHRQLLLEYARADQTLPNELAGTFGGSARSGGAQTSLAGPFKPIYRAARMAVDSCAWRWTFGCAHCAAAGRDYRDCGAAVQLHPVRSALSEWQSIQSRSCSRLRAPVAVADHETLLLRSWSRM